MLKLIVAIIIAIIVLLFATSFLIFTFKSVFQPRKRAPYVWTFKRHLKLMKKLNIPKNSTMLDLGCGDGKALRFFYNTYQLKKWIGYDINPYAIIRWKIINKWKWKNNISLHHKNFLNINIKWYKYIYIYLRTKQLADIENRIRQNKDKNTIIISNSFKFSKHKSFKTIKDSKGKDAIFLYK